MADRDETSRPADSSEVREEFQKLGRAISEWLEFENQYVNPGQQPAGDSIARAEIAQEARWAGEWGQQPLSLVYQIADLKLLAARDHLMALALLLVSTGTALAPYTVVRSVLEAASRAWWILDPTLDPLARIGRGMTDWLHDMWRLDQLGSLTLGKPASSIDLSELPPELLPRGGTLMRLDHKEIVAAAERHGLSILLQSGRKALGERRPDTSSLLKELVPNDDFGPAHLAYKTYSAVAHAELPGITFGMGWDLDPQSDGTYAAWRRLSPEYIAAAAGIAMLCSALATERRVHAYGSLPKVRYTAARDRAMAPFAAVMLRLVQRGR